MKTTSLVLAILAAGAFVAGGIMVGGSASSNQHSYHFAKDSQSTGFVFLLGAFIAGVVAVGLAGRADSRKKAQE